jgi:GntR family transcriptional regulator
VRLHLHHDSEIPIYRQIVRQVSDGLAGGALKPGDRLPSHRELAGQLAIAPLTVKKAYDTLERQGLIHTQRGRGTFVRESLPVFEPAARRERLRDSAERLLTQAALNGVPLDDLLGLLAEIAKGASPDHPSSAPAAEG